jgi:nucleoside-diphosphate kinase
MIERTLVILKPTAVERGIIGRIISRVEEKGLRIAGARMIWMDRELAERQYAEHREKQFFEKLVAHMTSSPIMLLVVEGESAIASMRQMAGATDPLKADAGSIRGQYAINVTENVIHASDSEDSAKREIELFFNEEELYSY